MKRRPKVGTLVSINLGNGFDAFGRVLPNAQLACYNFTAIHDEPVELDAVYDSALIFVTAVMNSAFKSTKWKALDLRPLESALAASRSYFICDRLDGSYRIYDSATGGMRPASYEECQSLESAAVWDREHIEDRLRDHFGGKPNCWVKQLAIKPPFPHVK